MLRHLLAKITSSEVNHVVAVDWSLVERASWLTSLVMALGAAGSVVVGWNAQRRQRSRQAPSPATAVAGQTGLVGASLAAPTTRLPPVVRGREDLRRALRRSVRRPRGRVEVLAGMGGVGKSTIALDLYQWAVSRRWRPKRAWWVSAHEAESLTDGLVSLARTLHANDVDVAAIRAGRGAARDRLWELLEQADPGWLLVFDDADDPRILDPQGDGKGWLRPSRRGLVLVTSRVRDERLWGSNALVRHVEPLVEDDAVQVLRDLAPAAAAEADASGLRELARRLGRLPLGLHQAGTYVGSRSARHRSFASYLQAWTAGVNVLAPTGAFRDGSRAALMQTWELSLDALAQNDLSQARPLLRLLSCYAAATPIPESLLRQPVVRRLAGDSRVGTEDEPRHWLEGGIDGLDQMSLLDREQLGGRHTGLAIVLHPIVAETNRLHLNGAETAPQIPDPSVIRHVAVELVAAVLDPLRSDDNGDWPQYDVLAPHVRELTASTAGHLDQDGLTRLLTATADTIAFYTWSSYEMAAERLADIARPHVERLPAEHPDRLLFEHERAWAIGRNGRWREAAAILRSVLDKRKRVLGAQHPGTLDTQHKLAWALGRLGDWTAAGEQLRRVNDDRLRVLGPDHPDTLHTQGCLAWAVGQLGRPDEAEDALRKVIATRTRVFGEEHVETWDVRHGLAELMVRLGRYGIAEEMLRELITVRDAVYGVERPETLELRPRYWLACALRGLGRHAQADREFARLLADQERALGPNHPATQDTRRQLGAPP